ncbi:MAG: T9SS type A sorting domain-containing protein [Flavobacteriales bacterium]|nr:T9SS type A sorting domain-containing protein [Flavobacteriales bacterium]
MRKALLSPLLLVASAAVAQLAPQTEATLFRHLTEVNAQWPKMAPDLLEDGPFTHFTTDAERIATHLHLVGGYLKTHVPAGFTAEELAQRNSLLNDLEAYADRGVFPINYVLPYRNPVFIDPHGTACAVGQLIIESGHRELAERISHEMNLAYVREINLPELGVWAREHGFTADELAWIQPAYGSNPGWVNLGNGTDAPVTTLLALNSGELLVAGTFTSASGVDCRRVALWNGAIYQPLGNGLNGRAECAVEYSGKIFVGGSFQGGLRDIAMWNGTSWKYGNAFPGMNPLVNALHVHNGRLYAAGSSSGFAGTDHEVRRLSGSAWVPVGGKMNGPIHAMASFRGTLTIGGSFTGTAQFGPVDSSIQHVAQLVNGGWQQLSDGLNAPVYDLEMMNAELYAGGDVYDANGNLVFGFAKHPLYGNAWEPLMDPNNPLLPSPGYTRILTLHTVDNAAIYVGGRFSFNYGLAHGRNFAVYHANPGVLLPSANVNKDVLDVSTYGGRVVFGGAFTSQTVPDIIFPPYTSVLNHIAIWSPGGDWKEAPMAAGTLSFSLAPNPAEEVLNITYAAETGGTLLIRDAVGRVVANEAFGSDASRNLDVSDLAPGMYSVVIIDGGQVGTKTFLKH